VPADPRPEWIITPDGDLVSSAPMVTTLAKSHAQVFHSHHYANRKLCRRVIRGVVKLEIDRHVSAMPASIQTLRGINEANSRFWRERHCLFDKRMANDPIRETASEAWQAQRDRAVPLACQFSFEKALEDAERAGQRFLAHQARKGGTAHKSDALQILIHEIVTHRPHISAKKLLEALKARQHLSPIDDIGEDAIHFNNHDGRSKEATISGLKDRLNRAKKKLNSR
jgi:hypothetical protein